MNPYFQQPNATLTPDILVHLFRSRGQHHIHTHTNSTSKRFVVCILFWIHGNGSTTTCGVQLKQPVRCKLHFGKTCPLDQAVGFSSPKVHMNCAMTDVAPPPPPPPPPTTKTPFLVERFGHQRCRGITMFKSSRSCMCPQAITWQIQFIWDNASSHFQTSHLKCMTAFFAIARQSRKYAL